tara:strand:- start:124 stop:795 length:672 start_codon:yes stop_codon:yes gene_type:complete
MHQKKIKTILIYFFLLLTVGSINNSNIGNLKFEEIKYIKILGLNNVNKDLIEKDIKDLDLENIFFLKKKDFINVLNSNSLVESFIVFKKYPSTLQIKIKETNLVAKINKDDKIFYVGTNGKLSEKKIFEKELPFIFGKPNIQEFLLFKKNIDKSNFSFEEVKNLYFFPSKRWDIELKNNIILKLPKENVKKSLNDIFQFLKNNNFNKMKTIDARVKNQIIINE